MPLLMTPGGKSLTKGYGTRSVPATLPSKSDVERVEGDEFVRGFVQHTLPTGFQKIHYYGWMSANSKISLDEVKWLIWLFLGWTYWLASGHAPQLEPAVKPQLRCAQCGGVMRVVHVSSQPLELLSNHALAYLDSR